MSCSRIWLGIRRQASLRKDLLDSASSLEQPKNSTFNCEHAGSAEWELSRALERVRRFQDPNAWRSPGTVNLKDVIDSALKQVQIPEGIRTELVCPQGAMALGAMAVRGNKDALIAIFVNLIQNA